MLAVLANFCEKHGNTDGELWIWAYYTVRMPDLRENYSTNMPSIYENLEPYV